MEGRRILNWLAVAFILLTPAFAPARAAPPAGPEPDEAAQLTPAEMDRAIAAVVSEAEYAWRLPKRVVRHQGESGFLATFFDQAGNLLDKAWEHLSRFAEKIRRWLRRVFKWRADERLESRGWAGSAFPLLFVCTALAASVLGIAVYRIWRGRRRAPSVVAVPVRAVPDISDEHVAADQLQADEWMTLAREFLDKAEYRLAIRAMFLSGLVRLSNAERLTLARCKSNRDYVRELRRRAHDFPSMMAAFEENVRVLEEVWYGTHAATGQTADRFSRNLVAMAEHKQGAAAAPARLPVVPLRT